MDSRVFMRQHSDLIFMQDSATYQTGSEGSTIYGIFEKNEVIILATSGGIVAHNRTRNTFYPITIQAEYKNKNVRYRYIQEEKENVWWVTSDYGIFELVKKNKGFEVRRPDGLPRHLSSGYSVRTYLRDKNIIWIATTDSGLIQYDENTKSTVYFRHNVDDINSLPNERINIIKHDREGSLLVGHDNGFSILKKGADHFENFVYQDGKINTLSNRYVYDFFDDDQKIWIATYGGGINILDKKTRNITYLTTKNGLCNDAIYTIIPENDSTLWLGTNKGLAKLFTHTMQFDNFEMDDGLPGDEFNMLSAFKDYEGEIFMGTITGVISFKPDKIQQNILQPKVYLLPHQEKWDLSE
jgi:ligand-binding sensor domain-containing protein